MILELLAQVDAEKFGRLCERVDMIYTLLTNHLHHHFLFNMALIAAVLSLATALIITLIKMKNSKRNGE